MDQFAKVFPTKPNETPKGYTYFELNPICDESIGGDMCKKVSWSCGAEQEILDGRTKAKVKILNRGVISFWFDLSKDHIVRKAFFQLGSTEYLLNNEVSQEPVSKIWFPSHWKYEQRVDDQLLEHEECDLEVISLNEPIPSSMFSCRNIPELIPGTTVRWMMDAPPPAEGKLVWDGRKVVGIGEYKFGLVMADRSSSRRFFLFFVNTAGISAIIAIVCFRAWRRQRMS